jgi:type IV pilus assembly protein PilN
MEKGYVLINLLPYREKNKKEKLRQISIFLSMFAVIGAALVFTGYSFVSLQIDTQKDRNSYIEKEEKKLDLDINEIADLKEKIKGTLEKRKVVERLQLDRSDTVNLLNTLALQLPDGTSLKTVKQTDDNDKRQDKITITGVTQSNNKVSAYMTSLESTNLYNNSTLVESKSIQNPTKKLGGKVMDDDSYNEFTLFIYANKKLDDNEKNPKKNGVNNGK